MSQYAEYLRVGSAYAALMTTPGWKILLDDMEKRADEALSSLRQCESSDPLVIKGLRDRWREAENSLKFIQVRATEAVERRSHIITEIGAVGPDLDLDEDDYHELQKILEFMGVGAVTATVNDQHNQSNDEDNRV